MYPQQARPPKGFNREHSCMAMEKIPLEEWPYQSRRRGKSAIAFGGRYLRVPNLRLMTGGCPETQTLT